MVGQKFLNAWHVIRGMIILLTGIAMTFLGVDPGFCVRGEEIQQGVWGPLDVPSGSRGALAWEKGGNFKAYY